MLRPGYARDSARCAEWDASSRAVFLVAFMGLAVRFHSIEPLSGFLLLPFVGYSVFGAALLNLSMHSSNAEVRASAASHLISHMWHSHIILCRKVVCLERSVPGIRARLQSPITLQICFVKRIISPHWVCGSQIQPALESAGRMPHTRRAHAGGRCSAEVHWREVLQEGAVPFARSGCGRL